MTSNVASRALPCQPAGVRRARRPGLRRAALAAAAAQLFLHAAGAMALDTQWTGNVGTGRAFWDEAANWSNGLPLAFSTRVLLGAADTTLRSGDFRADTLTGTGTLRLTGGSLELAGAGSSIERLELLGGSLSGTAPELGAATAATLNVGSLLWTGGRLAGSSSDIGPQLTVRGDAVLAGPDLYAGSYQGQLAFNGNTLWQDGASEISGDADLRFGPGGSFRDEAHSGNHLINLSYGSVHNEGRYVKTGAGDTLVDSYSGSFQNSGTMQIEQGRWTFAGYVGASWTNTGRVDVASELRLSSYRGDLAQNGTLNVLDGGKVSLAFSRTGSAATGQWNVASRGELEFNGQDQYPEFEGGMSFAGGALHNEGVVRFLGGGFSVGSNANLSGHGRVEVLQGASLSIHRGVDFGTLRIADPQRYEDSETGSTLGYGYSRVRVNGSLSLDTLEWADGHLETTGPVTVRGRTTLSDNSKYWVDPTLEVPGKRMASAFDFQGGVVWDGNGDIYGPGSIRVRAGTAFEDHNSSGTVEVEPFGERFMRPTRISVTSFLNEGRYMKTGAGETVIAAEFNNAGTVSVVNAGTLRLAGKVNNTGTLEAIGSRLVVWGPLAQYSTEEFAGGVLKGGAYVARNGTLALNLGNTPSGTAPALINEIRSGTRVVLDGAQARIVTAWQGDDVDALSQLQSSSGAFSLFNGATLRTREYFVNAGEVTVGAGSTLDAAVYAQWGGKPGVKHASWLGGTLDAAAVTLREGFYSAGVEGEVGTGHLVTPEAELGATLLLDIDGAELYDRLFISGRATLGGEVQVTFGDNGPVLGTFRFLTADGGLDGTFAGFASDLDPARFSLTAFYGSDYVELTIAAVPEPGTYALMGLGLLGLAGWSRRRRSH